jgi:hypothetical protein
MRTTIDGVVNEVGANTTVIKQGIAFRGGAVTGNGFRLLFAMIKNSKSLRLVSVTFSPKER